MAELQRGVFTLSLDFELAWGSRDLVEDSRALEDLARRTRDVVFPRLLRMLDRHRVVATWATVGNLFLDGTPPGPLHPDLTPPRHAWRPDWLASIPRGSESEHPAYYGRSLVLRLRDAGQEIGSHSFTHPVFGDPGCSRACAESELALCVREAEAIGVRMVSFVFPRNVAGHLDLLPKYGFRVWRGLEPTWFRDPRVPKAVSRIGHLAEVAVGRAAPTVSPTFADGLWNVPASNSILPIDGVRRLIPLRQRVLRATRGIDAAARARRVSHLYFHPINLASAPDPMLDAVEAVVRHAAAARDAGRIDVLSMGQIADRLTTPA